MTVSLLDKVVAIGVDQIVAPTDRKFYACAEDVRTMGDSDTDAPKPFEQPEKYERGERETADGNIPKTFALRRN